MYEHNALGYWSGLPVGRGGALSGPRCTDARTKDCETYPKQCDPHFEFDPPFHCVLFNHCVQSESTLSSVVN